VDRSRQALKEGRAPGVSFAELESGGDKISQKFRKVQQTETKVASHAVSGSLRPIETRRRAESASTRRFIGVYRLLFCSTCVICELAHSVSVIAALPREGVM
jgi:hypothetical protein